MKRIKNCTKAYVFVGILFFLFGGLTVFVQLLVPHLRDIFELNYTHASLLLLFFFLPYLLFSIPAGFILARLGYQRGIIIGLILIALGALLFHPASEERQFSLFLLASFVLGSGITFLQVAANPYVALLGEPSSAPVRLTFSQAFNALGTMVAPLAGGFFLLNDEVKTSSELAKLSTIDRNMYFQQEALAIQIPFLYIALAVTFLAFLFALIRLRTGNCIGYEEPSKSYNYVALLKKPSLLLAAIGIFLYVGAEVVIGSFAVNYFLEMNVVKELAAYPQLLSLKHFLGKTVVPSSLYTSYPKAIVAYFLIFYWGGAMVGRFIGAFLAKRFSPSKLLMIAAVSVISLLFVSVNTGGILSMVSLLAVGLFNSIMFPIIFSLGSEDADEQKTEASALLCTMIVGGGFIPVLHGFFVDYVGFRLAYLTLVVCYGYILFFGFYSQMKKMRVS